MNTEKFQMNFLFNTMKKNSFGFKKGADIYERYG